MAVKTHYLRGNASEWSPSRVAFFDTETRSERHDSNETMAMHLWVAGVVDRRKPGCPGLSVRTAHGGSRAELSEWVEGATVGARSTWLYAHNLGFDLTTSRLPDYLNRRGWRMGQWHFAGRNVSGSMRKGSKTIRLCDSTSLLPHPLEHIGRQLGRPKLPMPHPDAPQEEWLEYCTRDVLILAEAVLTLMDWWDREKLGHWTSSGPALGWNAMRHMMDHKSILIQTEDSGPQDDRPAIRGGRRDLTRVGTLAGGPFALVDFSNAYLTVAATQLLPKKRLAHYDGFTEDCRWLDGPFWGLVADCDVETEVPRYPLRTPEGIFYPVGRFRTVLCSPEIQWARESGQLRHIGPGFVHDLGYVLAPWAQQCLDWLDADNDFVPAVVRLMVKQWGRSVIGRFGARQSQIIDLGPALYPGWHLVRGTTGADHAPAADVHIGGRHWWYRFDQESENAYPAVLAFVESYVRVALGKMLEALGEDLWVCCDTDGAVLDLTRARSWLAERSWPLGRIRGPQTVAEAVCEAVRPLTWPLVPRVKVLTETLTVAGPQHYEGDTFVRASGQPGKPEVDADGSLHWWTWPRVGWQMENGSDAGFTRVETQWTHPSQLAHRYVLQDGSTVPVRAARDKTGGFSLVPWEYTIESMGEIGLHPLQSRALKHLT